LADWFYFTSRISQSLFGKFQSLKPKESFNEEKTTVKSKVNRIVHKFFGMVLAIALFGIFCSQGLAATISPKLQDQIARAADNASVGMTIVVFNTSKGLQESHLNILRSVGINAGETFPNLGMVAMPLTAGQIRALQNNPAVRSIWSNDKLQYHMHQARVVAGVERMKTERAFQIANGGMPVSGAGDFTVMVIDSGVDATHADLQFGHKVVQNIQTLVATSTLPGFTPNVAIENVQIPTKQLDTVRTALELSAVQAFGPVAPTPVWLRCKDYRCGACGRRAFVLNALSAWNGDG
jgi:hypothetical protein